MSKEIPKYFRINLSWIYDHTSKQCTKSIHNRCIYLRQQLTSDGLIRWAQQSPPRKWQKGDWEKFTDGVQKIHNQKSRWSPTMVVFLKKLMDTDFRDLKDFRSLYQGILHPQKWCNVR